MTTSAREAVTLAFFYNFRSPGFAPEARYPVAREQVNPEAREIRSDKTMFQEDGLFLASGQIVFERARAVLATMGISIPQSSQSRQSSGRHEHATRYFPHNRMAVHLDS